MARTVQASLEISSAGFEDIISDLSLLFYLVTLVTSYSIRSDCLHLGGKAMSC